MSTITDSEMRRSMGYRPVRSASLAAFWALLARDLRVLQKTIVVFAIRTIMQPLLLVFVFTYVFPKIGQGIGGRRPPSRTSRRCSWRAWSPLR